MKEITLDQAHGSWTRQRMMWPSFGIFIDVMKSRGYRVV
jgi:hypothetical protein